MDGLPSLPTDNLYKFMAISGLVMALASFFGPLRQTDRLEDMLNEHLREVSVLSYELGSYTSRSEELSRELETNWKDIERAQVATSQLGELTSALEGELNAASTRLRAKAENVVEQRQAHGACAPETVTAVREYSMEILRFTEIKDRYIPQGDKLLDESTGALSAASAKIDAVIAKGKELDQVYYQLGRKQVEIQSRSDAIDDLFRRSDRYLWISVAGLVVGSLLMILGFQWWYLRVQKHLDMALSASASNARTTTDEKP